MVEQTNEFRITVHMVSSLDGFIAKKDNSVSWFETTDTYDKGVAPVNPEEFLKTIDCYVMGSRTYDHAVELSKSYGWAYGDKPTIVMTSRNLMIERQNIESYSGDLNTLVKDRLRPRFKNVWVVGGALLVKDFIGSSLADDVRITVLPILLGDGKLFFDQVNREIQLHLKDVTAHKNGMVELWYEIRKE